MLELTGEDIKQAFLVLLKNKLLIIAVTIIGLFAGLLYSARQPEAEYRYEATVTLSVVFGQNLGQITGSTVILNYTEIATSNLVTEYAASLIEEQGLTGEQIQQMIRISSGNNPFVQRITARSDSPGTAIYVANAVAKSFVEKVSVITGSNTIQVLDPARSADMISLSGNGNILMIAPAAAFVIVCLSLIVAELGMGIVRSVKQCITDEGELLAVIPKVRRRRKKGGKHA